MESLEFDLRRKVMLLRALFFWLAWKASARSLIPEELSKIRLAESIRGSLMASAELGPLKSSQVVPLAWVVLMVRLARLATSMFLATREMYLVAARVTFEPLAILMASWALRLRLAAEMPPGLVTSRAPSLFLI